ncbi:putative sodium-dependent multivitamin transporter isoform X2 [Ptiloglossa arizonensis]|uniref:putative sodium-dependent multivitamin transporter isoform X2 n=1 Tax=Ptiloglossa arizonensis TaxID=3350558 RepID=UPI003F9EBF07
MGALQWEDYLVIAATLFISISIGIYYRFTGGRQKTMEEYFNASRSMNTVTVAIALVVSFMSAITLLGVSAENYTYGTQFVVINISYFIGTSIVCYGFLPVFFKLQTTSVYEYLEKRFGVRARMTASFVYWIQLILYSGIVLYAPSLALEATTGISKTGSIIIIGLACALYSSIGGIKAVLITDVFQGLLMFVAVFVIIGTAAKEVGGLGEIWQIAVDGKRVEFDSISIDPTVRHTWWSLIIGGLCTYLSLYGVNQVQVQRLHTVKDIKTARKALWLSWPILAVLSITTCFSGLAIYSKYYKCDPYTQKRISSSDMLMPLYVMDTMSDKPGLSGLFISGIFSAGLSTISAALNSLAAVTLEDYLKPLYRKHRGTQLLGGVLQVSLTIFGVAGGPLLGLFTLGMGTETATEIGSVTSTVISLAFLFWIAFGQPRPSPPRLPVSIDGCVANATISTLQQVTQLAQSKDNSSYFYLYRISYMWYAPIGFGMTFIIGLLLSYCLNMLCKKQEVVQDPNLFFPIIGNRIRRRQLGTLGINECELSKDVSGQRKYIFTINKSKEVENGDDISITKI